MPGIPPSGYRCLAIDHDDTAVRSTAVIHHPAYCAVLARLRPELPRPSLEEFFRLVHHGLAEHFLQELSFTADEMRAEYGIWREFVDRTVPEFHPALPGILGCFQANGGRIAVVSHSDEQIIRRDYAVGAPAVVLDAVYGWSEDAGRRKPSGYPILDAMERFELEPTEVLVLDDLGPGMAMARSVGADSAAAGWAHRVPEIASYMRAECTYYLETIADLAALLGVECGGRT